MAPCRNETESRALHWNQRSSNSRNLARLADDIVVKGPQTSEVNRGLCCSLETACSWARASSPFPVPARQRSYAFPGRWPTRWSTRARCARAGDADRPATAQPNNRAEPAHGRSRMNHLSGFGVKAVWVRVLGVDHVAGPAGQAARRPSLQWRTHGALCPVFGVEGIVGSRHG